MAQPRAIELVGGPLEGVIHELQGFVMPEQIALPKDGEPGELHWYCVDGDKGYFVRSEPLPPNRRQ